jgi:uncharacterized membrane protein
MRPSWIGRDGEAKVADEPKREAASEELIRAEAMLVRALADERKLLARCVVVLVVLVAIAIVIVIGVPVAICLLIFAAMRSGSKGPPSGGRSSVM